jgi:hypothetical protein
MGMAMPSVVHQQPKMQCDSWWSTTRGLAAVLERHRRRSTCMIHVLPSIAFKILVVLIGLVKGQILCCSWWLLTSKIKSTKRHFFHRSMTLNSHISFNVVLHQNSVFQIVWFKDPLASTLW